MTIQGVNNGGAVATGQPFNVQFRVRTRAGQDIPVSQLDRFAIHVSGTTSHYQRVIPDQTAVANITTHADGSYTYTFPANFPTTYAAPLNDSAFYGAADGELTGQAVGNGTYTVGIEARRTFMIDGVGVRDAGDAYFNFAIGGGAIAAHEVVIESNCAQCHTKIAVHGTNRFTVAGCTSCHNDGAEDRISADAAKATTGRTINFANMIHSIHRGRELPNVAATANGADPYRYQVIGFGESVNDFSDVAFPWMPGGTGFNEQTRNCGVCHDGASQGARYYQAPSRSACGGCHDDVNWSDGTHLNKSHASVIAHTLTKTDLTSATYRNQVGGIPHSFTDAQCTLCHVEGSSLDPRTLHLPPLADPALINGIKVVISSVSGESGAGFFQAGDHVTVMFNVLDRNDAPINLTDVSTLAFVMSGPVENYQRLIPLNPSSSTLTVKGNGGVPTSGTGPFTYVCPDALPSTYPAPFNNSTNFVYGDGCGELFGQAVKNGSYTLTIYAARQFTVDSITYRETSAPALANVRIGSAGTASGYPGYVSDDKCNSCHGDLRFHGNGRKGVQECVLCHAAGAEDKPTPAMGQTQDATNDTIDFKVMIHKIHAARGLSVVLNGGKYDLVGFGNNVIDFSTAELPALPYGPSQCTACHEGTSYAEPPESVDVRIWKTVCLSCHDSSAAIAHVEVNTYKAETPGEWVETCATCHGSGAEFAIDKVHLMAH
ncbi:MAG: OmcA/MtrC family decaheme c-type cytochrome [Phycisphaerae bacterium]